MNRNNKELGYINYRRTKALLHDLYFLAKTSLLMPPQMMPMHLRIDDTPQLRQFNPSGTIQLFLRLANQRVEHDDVLFGAVWGQEQPVKQWFIPLYTDQSILGLRQVAVVGCFCRNSVDAHLLNGKNVA